MDYLLPNDGSDASNIATIYWLEILISYTTIWSWDIWFCVCPSDINMSHAYSTVHWRSLVTTELLGISVWALTLSDSLNILPEFHKDFSFYLYLANSIETMGNFCVWFAEALEIFFCKATDKMICYIVQMIYVNFYKYSSFKFVLVKCQFLS